MNIYIAGYFNTKERLLPFRDELRKMGHVVISSWLDEASNPTAKMSDYTEQDKIGWANRDIDELDRSDLLILDTIDETPRGGREVEFGYTYGQGRLTVRVGPVRNVFHYLVEYAFETWEEVLEWIKTLWTSPA